MSNPISPLRQRMIDDMTFRNMSPSTHKVYIYAVANFSSFHGRSPDKLGIEDVREYRLHLIARGLKAKSISLSPATSPAWQRSVKLLLPTTQGYRLRLRSNIPRRSP